MGRNWEWSFNHGREQRLKREREAAEQGIAACRSIAVTAPCKASSKKDGVP